MKGAAISARLASGRGSFDPKAALEVWVTRPYAALHALASSARNGTRFAIGLLCKRRRVERWAHQLVVYSPRNVWSFRLVLEE